MKVTREAVFKALEGKNIPIECPSCGSDNREIYTDGDMAARFMIFSSPDSGVYSLAVACNNCGLIQLYDPDVLVPELAGGDNE